MQRASSEYRSASFGLKIVLFRACLIWSSINDSVTIHPRGHNPTMINIETILVLRIGGVVVVVRICVIVFVLGVVVRICVVVVVVFVAMA